MQPAPLYNEMAQGPKDAAGYWIMADDNIRLRIAVWPEGAKGTVLMFPGRSEHAEKYGPPAAQLQGMGYASIAIDWRGQGLSDRLWHDRHLGHVDDFSDYQRDVQAMLGAVRALNLPEPLYLLTHSMGGCIGLRALHNGLPVRAAVFSAPMWGIEMAPYLRPVAWGLSTALRPFTARYNYAPTTGPGTYVLKEAFDQNQLTNDPDMYAFMQRHAQAVPDIHVGGPSIHWLNRALVEIRALHKMPSPRTPAAIVLGAQESIVTPARAQNRAARWGNATLTIIPNAKHEVMMERPPARQAFYDIVRGLFDAP